MWRRKTSRTPLPSVLVALGLGCTLLVGTLEIHSGSHLGIGVRIRTTFVAAVSHPHEAAHAERTETVSVPPCPACLFHLQSLGAGLTPPPAVASGTVTPLRGGSRRIPLRPTPFPTGPSRAPPSA